jgi:MFS family permease
MVILVQETQIQRMTITAPPYVESASFDVVSRHSDYTLPTSNQHVHTNNNNETSSALPLFVGEQLRRPVFTNKVQQRYHYPREEQQQQQQQTSKSTTTSSTILPLLVSPMASPILQHHHQSQPLQSKPTIPCITNTTNPYAQTVLLGLALCAAWTPANVMAPHLTELASYYKVDRDLYFGSYLALATALPLGASLGFLADVTSRKWLLCATLVGGSVSCYATGQCATTYWQLFALRLLTVAFMSGSVPVAFSFVADLFAVEERNVASSLLAAMMGVGIVLGQVGAGMTTWQRPFLVCGIATMIMAVMCVLLLHEPERGGKEAALQDMIKAGTPYDKKLTWTAFWHAMTKNKSNSILLWQGFFSSLPWGVIFVFLNDYLSQERGFGVVDATYLVLLFGIGCLLGGILGGYWGGLVQAQNRELLPLFMSVTTILGIFPFLALLNTHFTNAHGPLGFFLTVSGGLITSLPGVNVRPCLINVNPPESRGVSLTAANVLVNLGRGLGPSIITLIVSVFKVDRKFAFNVTVSVYVSWLCYFSWLCSLAQLFYISW